MRFAVLGLLVATSALGQVPSADIEQVWLDPAARGSLMVGTGKTLDELGFRFGLAAFYTSDNLRLASSTVVADRLGFQVFGALGVTRWLELGASVPVVASQSGAAQYGIASAGLGNPFFHAKAAVLDDSHLVTMGIALAVGIPIGIGPALGNGGLELAPKLQLGKAFEQWQWGAEVGVLYRAPVAIDTSNTVGTQVWLAGTVTSVSTSGPRAEASARAHLSLAGGTVGAEAQLGVRWPLGTVELFASAGPGLGGAPSTPSFRMYLGFALANTP